MMKSLVSLIFLVQVLPLGSSLSVNNRPNQPDKLSGNASNQSPVTIDARRDDEGKSRTQRMFEKLQSSTSQVGGAGGISSWEAFLQTDERWQALKKSKAFDYDEKLFETVQNGAPAPYQFVTTDGASGNPKCWAKLRDVGSTSENLRTDYDIIVCGGTLGIFIATALQLKGHRVCVIEAGELRGREQEWNISMEELLDLVSLGIVTTADIDKVVETEFPSCRAGFKNIEAPTSGSYLENGIGFECVTKNVLNLGVSPSSLIEIVKNRFQLVGGKVIDRTPIEGIVVSERAGAAVDLGKSLDPITAKLVLDCMGNASPISRQQRYGMKPDGVCCVVGTCAAGFNSSTNVIGDIIYTNSEIQDNGDMGMNQYFWEAFPVGVGRGKTESDVKTTYMFTYLDAEEKRPSFVSMMEDYWKFLPTYQPSITDPENDLDLKRILFAYFPTYRDSALKPKWSRVLAVGDASGIQSPLSFGGFGALTRHLSRLTGAISEAILYNCLHKDDLGEINAYTPNLSATWMFQRAMSVRMGQNVNRKFVNRLLATNFQIMHEMGEGIIKPFLQDVIRIDGLAVSLAKSFVADPLFMPQIVAHVGLPVLIDWLGHVSMLTLYSFSHTCISPVLKPFLPQVTNPRQRFQWNRRLEAWEYGSGHDYGRDK